MGNGNIGMMSYVKGMPNQPDILVKAIDATRNNLDYNLDYDIRYLVQLPVSIVNREKCSQNFDIITSLRLKEKSSPLTTIEKETLNKSLVYNNVIDIHYNTCINVTRLHRTVGINNFVPSNILLSIHNIANYDNAFFYGSMWYGNGRYQFYSLGTMDITFHEQGHGTNDMIADLPYEGHSGAINEMFADINGFYGEYDSCKVNYDADPLNNVDEVADWVMGEEACRFMAYLRNFQDPTKAQQPAEYKGLYWADPNSTADYGGVHTNSGVGNKCFYEFCMRAGIDIGYRIFMAALRLLPTRPNYINLRDALKQAAGIEYKTQMQEALNIVKMTDTMVNDWTV